jgi:hypothetical protein
VRGERTTYTDKRTHPLLSPWLQRQIHSLLLFLLAPAAAAWLLRYPRQVLLLVLLQCLLLLRWLAPLLLRVA